MPGTTPAPFFFDPQKGKVDATPELALLLGAPAEGGIEMEDFLSLIAPTEAGTLRKALSEEGIILQQLHMGKQKNALLLGAVRSENGIARVRGLVLPETALFRKEALGEGSKEVEALAHIISHDLRAPLRSITGFGQMLRENSGKELDEKGKDLLDRVLAETERMNQMLIGMTRFSRLAAQSMVMENIYLGKECEVIWKDLAGEKSGELSILSDVSVRGDVSLIGTLFKELLSNSIKSKKEGKVNVSFLAKEIEGGIIGVVVDDGMGFDMRCASKLFAPFQKMHTNQTFPGPGIGLALTAKVAQKHGGKAWIAAAEDEGTAVFFTLRT